MSGGSMNYFYARLEEEANFLENTPERKAFARHLSLIAKALHDIEWVDSHDYARGDENEAILACIGQGAVLEAAIERAKYTLSELQAVVSQAVELQSKGK